MDVESKLKANPDLLGTKFIMINPEAISEMSPTIPKGFPKTLIPNNICQNEMADLASCLIDYEYNNLQCEDQQGKYYVCKTKRDSLIFKRIKEWEIQNIDELGDFERKIYISALDDKKKLFLNTYEAIPILPKNKSVRLRVANDIKQLEWRMDYINNAINNVYNV